MLISLHPYVMWSRNPKYVNSVWNKVSAILSMIYSSFSSISSNFGFFRLYDAVFWFVRLTILLDTLVSFVPGLFDDLLLLSLWFVSLSGLSSRNSLLLRRDDSLSLSGLKSASLLSCSRMSLYKSFCIFFLSCSSKFLKRINSYWSSIMALRPSLTRFFIVMTLYLVIRVLLEFADILSILTISETVPILIGYNSLSWSRTLLRSESNCSFSSWMTYASTSSKILSNSSLFLDLLWWIFNGLPSVKMFPGFLA